MNKNKSGLNTGFFISILKYVFNIKRKNFEK